MLNTQVVKLVALAVIPNLDAEPDTHQLEQEMVRDGWVVKVGEDWKLTPKGEQAVARLAALAEELGL